MSAWRWLRSATAAGLACATALPAWSYSSGYNYVTPFASAVPEPNAAALMLAGLLGAASSRRRAMVGGK